MTNNKPPAELSLKKDCPFCGSDDLSIVAAEFPYVRCYQCECESRACKTKEQAIEVWNTRASSDAVLDDALQKLYEESFDANYSDGMRRFTLQEITQIIKPADD